MSGEGEPEYCGECGGVFELGEARVIIDGRQFCVDCGNDLRKTNAQQPASVMTKREHAAIAIMAGFAACDVCFDTVSDAAGAAVKWADALLAELGKPKPEVKE